MQRSLGIARDEERPGFQHFYLQPLADPTGALRYAKGYYDSPYGRIESGWEVKADAVDYRFVVPANTQATLRLPAKALTSICLDGQPLSKALAQQAILANGQVEITLEAGRYVFSVKK
ncbi:MAG: alpha-L-rhamnosidase C-terminal domain-containing protein [Prevotella sp.]